VLSVQAIVEFSMASPKFPRPADGNHLFDRQLAARRR
jgi:hypothetical protein